MRAVDFLHLPFGLVRQHGFVAGLGVAFAQRLVSEARVAAIPVGVFYEMSDRPTNARVVRFCFAKRDATLREGLARLTAFLGSAGP